MSGFAVRAGNAVRWSAISQVGRRVGQIATTALLARLLAPEDFGVAGMATMVFEFAFIFRDLGTSAAVIQQEKIDSGLLNTVFWTNIVLGLLAAVLLFAAAPPIASFFKESRLTALLQVLSLTFVFTGSSVLQQALLERRLAFDKLAKIEGSSFLLGSATAIVCGLRGWGVWSFVAQTLVMQAALTIMLWHAGDWRPSKIFRWSDLKVIQGYSLNLAGSQVLTFTSRNADNILIGRFLGAEALGFYSIAYKLMLSPIQSVTFVVLRALFPVYARLQDDDARFRSAYVRTSGAIAMLSFPVMIGIMAISKPLVLTLLGAAWMPVAGLLLILAPVGLLQSIGITSMMIFRAKGRTDWMFRWNLFTSAVTLASFAIGLRWGVQGVAIAYLAANLLLVYPSYAIPFRLIALQWREFGKALAAPLAASLVMGSVLMQLVSFPGVMRLSSGILLGVTIIGGALVYALVFGVINRHQALNVWRTLAHRGAPQNS